MIRLENVLYLDNPMYTCFVADCFLLFRPYAPTLEVLPKHHGCLLGRFSLSLDAENL